MNLKIVKELPPNIEKIKQSGLIPDSLAVFAYGDIVYNPSGQEIPADLIYHEDIHRQQQEFFASPEIWWDKYLFDKNFRQEQEVEAYASQINWIKKHLGTRMYEYMLNSCATALSSPMYGLNLTKSQAHTLIRLKAKGNESTRTTKKSSTE